ncbi:MAG TPA: ABC transporter permease subunit [Solirubrobacteraceae bacterium]|jgi:phosphate transport system permease protein|nr:ABC transporter permease subunit [Solirubrobacteraceae bacterium]
MAGVAISPPRPSAVVAPPRERISSWPAADRAFYALCWVSGIGLCLIALWIVVFMLVKGISFLKPSLLWTSPNAGSIHQTQNGGFLDPIEGTFLVTAIGTLIAAPLGVGVATWLTEYARPSWFARIVDSAIEMLAGVPSIVLALFGLLIFSQGFLGFLSQGAASGSLGQSFVAAGVVMALIALPLVVASTREGLTQLPPRMREASFALGKTKATTSRYVLLPAIKPSIAGGIVLGMGRIIGDTAIVTILLGGAAQLTEPVGHTPVLGLLRGTGSTLTSYVYYNSPAGEGNAHEKAYAAAFVLLIMVLGLNALVTRLTAGNDGEGRRRRLVRIPYFSKRG